jgi:endonuclease/exonuclease/phosphatase family metal-dependent hydrolase
VHAVTRRAKGAVGLAVAAGLVLGATAHFRKAPDAATAAAVPASSGSVRVMSFNIRYGTAEDGEDAWPRRRDLVVETIRAFDPDVLGLQEALRFQLDELAAALPGYAEVGVGRDDGVRAGEYAAILFRSERFEPLASGTFWLSDEPEKPASATWGNRIPRICTWVSLRDRATGTATLVLNTHFDHESAGSRERAAALIAERIDAFRDGSEIVLTGDFNTPPDSGPMARLRSAAGTSPPGLRDAFSTAHPDSADPGTFHGFRGTPSGGRIDAILVSGGWEVRAAGVIRASRDGRYPSDHFPVSAILLRSR